MNKFKVGDTARCNESYPGGSYTKGKDYKVTGVYDDFNGEQRILTAMDNHGSTTNGWRSKYFDRVPTRNETVRELRKAIGMPEFAVGDVVKHKRVSVAYRGVVLEVTPSGLLINYDNFGRACDNADDIDLITPAVAAPVTPAKRLFEVDDYVRTESGFGVVLSDDGDGEESYPYTVAILDGTDSDHDTEDFCASDLKMWVPESGDRVEDFDGDLGNIVRIKDGIAYVEFDDGTSTIFKFTIEDTEGFSPSNEPKPLKRTQFKKGDRVKYLGGYPMNAKAGATGVLYEDEDAIYVRIKWDKNDFSKDQFDGAYEKKYFELVVARPFQKGDIVEVIQDEREWFGFNVKDGDLAIVQENECQPHFEIKVKTSGGVKSQQARPEDIRLAA